MQAVQDVKDKYHDLKVFYIIYKEPVFDLENGSHALPPLCKVYLCHHTLVIFLLQIQIDILYPEYLVFLRKKERGLMLWFSC